MKQSEIKILLIDDDEVDVRTVRRAIRDTPQEQCLQVERNGREALQLLRGRSSPGPLLILLDLNMPTMNGLEFLDALRADPKLRHHVVFDLSTSEAESDIRAAYDRFAAGYLMKAEIGARPEILTRLLASYLGSVHLPS